MIKKLTTHITFFTILLVIYLVFNAIIYSRKIDTGEAMEIYLFLTLLVFCINLIKRRKIKWTMVILINMLFLLMSIPSYSRLTDSMLDLFLANWQEHTPFLPRWYSFRIENTFVRITCYYLLYPCGAQLYWYGIYRLSKRIINMWHK
jgi:hypothetical protein